MKTVIARRDEASPFLADLQASLNPKSADALKLRKAIATRLETRTRTHILFASASRHKTALRLGASPTGYLVRLANAVESEVFPGAGTPCRVYVYGEIFSRVDRAVEVRPRNKEWLAIPATRLAYGRRPREFSGLRFIQFRDGLGALVKKIPKNRRKDDGPKFQVIYWLKKGVTLPQDKGLLPTPAHYAEEMEYAALDYLIEVEKRQKRAATSIIKGRRR